jgi:F-type H+-transporting ATPase subunit b
LEILNTLLDSLKIDPWILLINGVMFLILLQVLNAIFWKPMMKHLDKRKDEITHAYQAVENTRREMENLRSDYQSRLAQIESEARGRIQSTVRDAQKQREEMIARARAESEETVKRGLAGIEAEQAQAVARMRDDLDDVALSALGKALNTTTDSAHRKLVDDYIAEKVLKS